MCRWQLICRRSLTSSVFVTVPLVSYGTLPAHIGSVQRSRVSFTEKYDLELVICSRRDWDIWANVHLAHLGQDVSWHKQCRVFKKSLQQKSTNSAVDVILHLSCWFICCCNIMPTFLCYLWGACVHWYSVTLPQGLFSAGDTPERVTVLFPICFVSYWCHYWTVATSCLPQ